jgi:hypothetical protein
VTEVAGFFAYDAAVLGGVFVAGALEGLELDSLRGSRAVIRPVDHQANVGSYIGVVAWDPAFPDFAAWKDAVYVPGDRVWRSEAEVRAIRARSRDADRAPDPS